MRIFLTGMMGCGKSFWAPQIAAAGGFDYIDLDKYIEEKVQQSVSDIFKNKGEDFFRKMESACLIEIIQKNINCIVATGGGTPCFHDNLELMKSSGKVIYLKTNPSTLADRITSSNKDRPLLHHATNNDITKTITDIIEARKKCYENSDVIIDMNSCDEFTFVENFIKKYV